MNQRPALIWDFDGTLAYQEGKWSGAMLAAMDELAPGHGLTLKDVRAADEQRISLGRTGKAAPGTNKPASLVDLFGGVSDAGGACAGLQ